MEMVRKFFKKQLLESIFPHDFQDTTQSLREDHSWKLWTLIFC